MIYFDYFQVSACSLWMARLFPVFATRLESSQYAVGMLNCLKSGVQPDKLGEYGAYAIHNMALVDHLEPSSHVVEHGSSQCVDLQ